LTAKEKRMQFFSFWRSLASYRVRIALNLKSLTAEVIDVNLMQGEQRAPPFKAVNPMMALPALIDGEGPALYESLAILEYIDETHPDPPLMPQQPRARARVRALAQIVACDSHPLIVPRVRDYLEHEFGVDEAARMAWCRHWTAAALHGLEEHLVMETGTGTFCHGDRPTIADICLMSQVAAAAFFSVDMAPYKTVARIAQACSAIDAVARAHPLRQPGAVKV
jgi:maleylacetoacetate isomerase